MDRLNSKVLYIVGGALVLSGFIVPLLMVLEIIPMMLWLEMIIIVFQMIGFMCGLIGSALYKVKNERDKTKH